jgi:4-phospho-D-threonate 3-dehydrogenase / 4-phospho-D-erythronate 3-dehydrogenase
LQSKPPIVGITMGDAAGIGPEIINKALSLTEIHTICRPIVIGDKSVLSDAQKTARTRLKIQSIRSVHEADFSASVMNVLDLANVKLSELKFGYPQAMAGKASFDYVKKAVELALAGEIDAITTAPISKEAMNMAGIRYPGHTEILADMTHSANYAMMFVAGQLRVILVTIHVSLRSAIDLIKKDRVLATIELASESMKRFGFTKPRIVVAGLNPHAGEAGMFGNEDIKEIVPAVEAARNMGIDAVGPLPADTVFYRANRKEFDIVVAMYHDQGCIPIKLLGFETGVNITVGLPIIRTSPDHGTAYDRAERRLGTGNPTSIVEAIKMASILSAS